MIFLVISQRAYPDNTYSLKDLTGHGRIDVVFRCILAATRKLVKDSGNLIYCYLKGKSPGGWLELSPENVENNWDEIELAAVIKEHWTNYFTQGSLEDLMMKLNSTCYYLHEDGILMSESQFNFTKSIIILGAQNDLTSDDLAIINPVSMIKLGDTSMLASHAIIYFRQKLQFNSS